eukprot:Skav236430  [mRNA]  locus=scaffold1156:197892:218423:- [translate_table: standard]
MAAMMRERSRTPAPNGRRPEEWYCLNCGEHNFARNTECRKCGAPVATGVPLSELEMEIFVRGYPVEDKVLEQLKALPREQQTLVMKVGTLKGAKDVNAVLVKRMSNAKNGIISGYGSGPKGTAKGGFQIDNFGAVMAMMAAMGGAGAAGAGAWDGASGAGAWDGWDASSAAWGGADWGAKGSGKDHLPPTDWTAMGWGKGKGF